MLVLPFKQEFNVFRFIRIFQIEWRRFRRMRTADAIVKLLIANEVEVVFGVSGDTSMVFHDAFEKHSDQIRYVACRDERHAGYMADTYSRVSGKPGVVDVPSGGGVLYVAPALSEATSSSIPLICFSSDIPLSSEETGALTELRQEDFLKPITKWNGRVKLASKVPHFIRKAFRMATGGRPGAVHLSIPEDIHEEDFNFSTDDLKPLEKTKRHSSFRVYPEHSEVVEVVEMLAAAERPVVLAGGGVHLSGAYEELAQFSNTYNVPVVTSINGKGSVDETSPNAVGVIGVNGGSDETNSVVKDADLVMVLGSKLNNVTTVAKSLFSHSPKVVQVDVSEEMLDLNIRADLPIHADIKGFLSELNRELKGNSGQLESKYKDWSQACQKVIEAKLQRIQEEVNRETDYVNPAKIIDFLDRNADPNSVFVMDAGTQNPYMASHFKNKKVGRHTVFDRGHGNLGYALSASIGAKVARPQSRVFSLFGDGSFAMSVGELETAARQQLPIIFMNFQNNSYGWIKKLQQLYYKEKYMGVDFTAIDGAKIAEGFGVKSLKIESNETLEAGLSWAMNQDCPVFLDIYIDPITDITPPVTNWREDSKLKPEEREALTY